MFFCSKEFRLLTTVPLLEACLPPEKFFIHTGRRFSSEEFPLLHKLFTEPNTLLLYPGPDGMRQDIFYSMKLAYSGTCTLTGYPLLSGHVAKSQKFYYIC